MERHQGRQDHPRIRGEHLAWHRLGCAGDGSSPHTRGAHLRQHGARIDTGIIPAYAGSTAQSCSQSPTRSDHPRIRGEHSAGDLQQGVPGGSSPHTRGARSSHCNPTNRGRIIPAYAGSTSASAAAGSAEKDHPRIRGEHVDGWEGAGWARGSSPHTRGALRHPTCET